MVWLALCVLCIVPVWVPLLLAIKLTFVPGFPIRCVPCVDSQAFVMTPPSRPPFRTGRNGRRTGRVINVDVRRSKCRSNKKYKLRENVGVISCKNNLKACMLNVDGLSEAAFADTEHFVEIERPDVVFLFETKRRLEEMAPDIDIPGYENFEVRRSDVDGHKPGGGIACYTRRCDGLVVRRHSPNISHGGLEFVNNERVWVLVDSLQSRTAILGVYMGCQYQDDRNAEWNDNLYLVLRREVMQLRSEGYRIAFLGDMNGHVGSVLGQGIVGNNDDINKNGRRFLDFLEVCDLRHINGECRQPGRIETKICKGLWTRQRGNSRSVIDYAGVSSADVGSVVSMTIDDVGVQGGLSDHNWVTLVLRDQFKRMRLLPNVVKKKRWNFGEDQDWSQFQVDVLSKLPSVSECSGMSVNRLASLVSGALHSGGMSAFGLRTASSRSSMRSRHLPPDLVCEMRKLRELGKVWKSLVSSHRGPNGVSEAMLLGAEESWEVQKSKVSLLFTARRGTLNAEKVSDHRSFWSAVSGKVKQSADISAVLADDGTLKCEPDAIRLEAEQHLCRVFEGSLEVLVPEVLPPVLPSPGAVPVDHLYCVNPGPTLPHAGVSDCVDRNPNNWLARAFTMKEVKSMAMSLLNNKASGFDRIPNEFIKNAPDRLFSILSILFNKMKDENVFPVGWNRGRITLIHKRGLRVLLSNYRPITVLISLAGLYSKVLNGRLTEVVERHNILGEIQGGFRCDRGVADSTFVLHSIFWKAKARKEAVNLGFLDVSKAYDSVNREILWRKLALLGISGKFLDMLKSMYSGDSVDTVVNGVCTRSVFLRRGLRQGCSLSPILFSIYISDIGHDLSLAGEGFLLGDSLTVSGLLFADDIVVVARSAAGLKRLLNLVNQHCQRLKLVISEEKSQVVSPTDDLWEIFGDEGLVATLKQVVHYKYLGLETYSSMFRTTVEKQKKCVATAKKYMFACLYLGRSGSDLVNVAIATWLSVAVPSVLFGCETLLLCETKVSELESIQSQVAKRILAVSKNTVNIAAQTELGFPPIRMVLYLRQLQFYFRVLRLPDSRWAKVALLDHLRGSWASPYLAYIYKLRSTVSLFSEPPNKHYLRQHLYHWALSMTNSSLLSHHLPGLVPLASFKRQHYVFAHDHLSTLASFRLSNAGLGNICPLPGRERFSACPRCLVPVPCTEEHVLFDCASIQGVRIVTGLALFKTLAVVRGLSTAEMFQIFVRGLDLQKKPIAIAEYLERGAAITEMRNAWLKF